jgi:hypothetical protein
MEAVKAVEILESTVRKHDKLLERIIEKLELIETRLDAIKPAKR